MTHKKYIILPLVLLILTACSDKTNEPNEEEPTTIVPVTDTSSGADDHSTTEDPIVQVPVNIRPLIVENDDNETEVIVEETIPSNWYIRLVAEDVNRSLRTNLSQLGALEESDAVQNHTLISGGRWSNPYLDILFVNPDGMPAGSYKTNYHVYGTSITDSWQFTVETDDSNAEIHLSWNGLYVLTPYLDAQDRTQYREYRSTTNPLIPNMKLIDSLTSDEVPAMIDGEVQTYIFNMGGATTRHFEWVVQYE